MMVLTSISNLEKDFALLGKGFYVNKSLKKVYIGEIYDRIGKVGLYLQTNNESFVILKESNFYK